MVNNQEDCFLAELMKKYPFFNDEEKDFDSRRILESNSKKFVFFGSGISASKGISKGLGFEYLEFLTSSIIVAKSIGVRNVVQLVSDLDSGFSEREVSGIVEKEKRILNNIFKNINQNSDVKTQVVLSSEISTMNVPYINKLRTCAPENDLSDYTIRQLADTEFLRYKGGIVKLGWSNSGGRTEQTRDERYFNNLQKKAFPNSKYNFIYANCANDLQGGRRPPYTVVEGEDRYILGETDVLEELKKRYSGEGKFSKNVKKFLNRMRNSLSEFEKISGVYLNVSSLPEELLKDEDFFKMGEKLNILQKSINSQIRIKGASYGKQNFVSSYASGR